MKYLDYPPVWLLAFMTAVYALARVGLSFAAPPLVPLAGWILIALGVGLMCVAAWTMWRHKTTVIPHKRPTAIVTNGVYALSRNPIYLGDAFTLAGFALLCGSWMGIVLVPAFMAVIQKRFIIEEEQKLRAGFPQDFSVWAMKTRRWL
ncbi:methyltransferase family protein [Celeribacter baekdonensis]|jgi:protein-S-isoprenylcysteine O-methyltransferase Ste14|uniref:S-isoprenylcysteine methyltransferase n=1 Tax=Celeribacter baekdonensis TaxID=875171 RepID=A0A2R4M382_9RHOB|nr:isoprenylcysteine carboxylmethyltransferase family protein [Celeribacter baekdonensis]AVW91641.1 S-isoprenylcysteine methyltransferase [Celeribacter baekdonensis]